MRHQGTQTQGIRSTNETRPNPSGTWQKNSVPWHKYAKGTHCKQLTLQRTGVDKNMGLGGRPPYHLKSAQGRGRHHLKWPFSFFLFMGLVGYLHPINPFIWPQCASFVAFVLVSRREDERSVSQRQLGSRLGCVQRRLE